MNVGLPVLWCGTPLASTSTEQREHMRRWIIATRTRRSGVPPSQIQAELELQAAVLEAWLERQPA